MESLLQHPKPREDEWLGSWIFRTARANETSLKQLFEHLGWTDTTGFPDNARLLQLANATGQQVPRLEQMVKGHGTVIESNGRNGIGGTIYTFLGIRFAQVCPICLSTDQVPYFRLSWVMNETIACPVHQTMMFDACPHCGARILPRGTPFVRKRQGINRDSKLLDDLRRCGNCHGDLGDARHPSPALTGLLDVPPGRINAHLSPTTLEWSGLVEATKRLISNDGLYQLLDLHTLTLRFDKIRDLPSTGRQHSIDHRFGRELLTDVLLGPSAKNGASVLRRMQTFGLWLQAIRTPARASFFSPRFYRFWMADFLINASEADLLREWPVLTNTLLDLEQQKVTDPRPVSHRQMVVLQPEAWETMSVGLEDSLAWNSDKKSRWQTDHQKVIEGFLWTISNNATVKSIPYNYPYYEGIFNRIRLWTDDGRLGIALGLLYGSMMRNRKDIFLDPEEDPDSWHAQLATIFLSDGMIELLRTVHPALHRELLKRLVQRVAQAQA